MAKSPASSVDPSPAAPMTPEQAVPMTPEQAADLVDIPVETLFAFRDYGTHVIVITVQGRKLDSREVAGR